MQQLHTKYSTFSRKRAVHVNGGFNILAMVAAHIPCCGSQFAISMLGLEALGVLSTTLFYRFQFLIPLVISIGVTMVFALLPLLKKWGKSSSVVTHSHAATNWRSIAKNFGLNLVVGYGMLAVLFLAIPPHEHRLIDANVMGSIDTKKQILTAYYYDKERIWPWTYRYFKITFPPNSKENIDYPAQELHWAHLIFDRLYRKISADEQHVIPVHLYGQRSKKQDPQEEKLSHPAPTLFYIELLPRT